MLAASRWPTTRLESSRSTPAISPWRAVADGLTRLAAVKMTQGKLDEAERILPQAKKTFADQHALYDWAYAADVTAEIALARKKPEDAADVMAELHERAPRIEKPALRIHVAVTDARVLAALGKRDEVLRMLGAAAAEAEKLELPLEALGATLALGELQLAEPSTKKRGISTVERAPSRARALGLVHYDRKAGELLPDRAH